MKIASLALISAACASPCPANATIGHAVNTTSGTIIGHANTAHPYVSEYLGIPFASPPLGKLRFEPPQPYKAQGKPLVANTQPLSCPQLPASVNHSTPQDWINYSLDDGSYANYTSEDCLYLNIWTRYPFQGAPLMPVFVWIYGGGFHAGGIRDAASQGPALAEQQGVVVVTLNYRLGMLGFPGGPTLRQNLALLDQRLAVEWVRDNIAEFGGDPARIVIGGHSAGGASTDLYNFAWTDEPIISGSIVMSGSAITFGNRYANTSAAAWHLTANFVGCGNASTTSEARIIACMRTKTTTELLQATIEAEKVLVTQVSRTAAAYIGITGAFGPTIDNITVFGNYSLLAQERRFIQKPVLLGSNDDEGCFFVMSGKVPAADAGLITTGVFTCPIYHTAQGRLGAGVPTWKYRNFGAWPNTYASACPGRPWHGLEVYELFDSTSIASGFPDVSKEVDAEWYFRQAMMAFVKDPKSGLTSQVGWPALSAGQPNLVVLGLNTTLATVQQAAIWDTPCQTKFVSGAPNI